MRFLNGRNGTDSLFYGFAVLYLILYGLNFLILSPALRWAQYIVVFLAIFRLLSTNIPQRKKEADFFSKIIVTLLPFLKHSGERILNNKDYAFHVCDKCGVTIKVKRLEEKGKFVLTCPKCGNKFVVKNKRKK
ncbi:MAG: hypothetical protein PUI85_00495 [Eubacteriales bacterium]|nr:hypothetical protein [Eubacteriales bacterium]MDY3333074.1 hypothetical protein [Gallibacter sp.]